MQRFSNTVGALALVTVSVFSQAQISLPTAVDLALRNSPKVKMAQADVAKARASLSQTKDAFIPVVDSTAGVGKSSGPPLAVPVVFSVAAQSLVFNFSQSDYIRSARAGLTAAELTLTEINDAVVQDTASTYVGLENAQRRREVLADACAGADRLVKISQSRFELGVDPHVEISRSQVTRARLKLQQVQLDSEIDQLSRRLSRLTALKSTNFVTVADSIPAFAESAEAYTGVPRDTPGLRAAAANAQAKQYTAHGDKRYMFLPQLSLGANYSRITTAFSNYDLYYPAFNRNAANNENALSVGLQINVPLLDIMHRSKAKASAAEAVRARYEVEDQRMIFLDGRDKLAHAAVELAARAELAAAERAQAKDDLDAIELRLTEDAAGGESQLMTPKDRENARLQERQKYLEMLSTDLQLRQTEMMLMQQSGSLGDWLHRGISAGPRPVVTPSAVNP